MAEKNCDDHGRGSRAPEQVEELFASVERVVITRATGSVADLSAAQAGKRELATLSAVQVREGLVRRRNKLRGGAQ